jgi:toxin ParE1/3/4
MAKLPIVIHVDAHAEQEAAFDWYRVRSLDAARAFVHEIEQARVAIQESPESWAAYSHATRRYLLKHFPYVVVYRLSAERIEIVAIAHGRRKTAYWVERLTPGE